MTQIDRGIASLLLIVLGLPMLGTAAIAIAAAFHGAAWHDLLTDPQTRKALGLSVWTGLAATSISVGVSAWMLSHTFARPLWTRCIHALGPMLAVPHAAMAIGLAFLISPSGWVLRALSPWATGFEAPPPWVTTQDPWGLGLIATLVIKEVPFVLWAAATQLQRPDVTHRWGRELMLARSLGYSPSTAWWRVVWPQLWPRLRWPILAVGAYSLCVVEMAWVMGPTSPPSLAVLAWRWLLDASPQVNAQGAAAAWLLAIVLAGLTTVLWQLPRLHGWRVRWTQGDRRTHTEHHLSINPSAYSWALLILIYLAVMFALAVGSVAGVWPFPQLLPEAFTGQAWTAVGTSSATLGTTLGLALSSAVTALIWSVAWLECAPPRWRERLRSLLYLPLALPPVLWVVGLHGMALRWKLDATWTGLWLAHTLASVPYVLLALSPAYLGFDPRYRQITASLGHGRGLFLMRVKWPLLRAALASGLAIGFAVSVGQYLPTLFIGAGRFATVTTEAVTLASGAQRSLTAAYAWLQWLLPFAIFGLASWWGKPRRY